VWKNCDWLIDSIPPICRLWTNCVLVMCAWCRRLWSLQFIQHIDGLYNIRTRNLTRGNLNYNLRARLIESLAFVRYFLPGTKFVLYCYILFLIYCTSVEDIIASRYMLLVCCDAASHGVYSFALQFTVSSPHLTLLSRSPTTRPCSSIEASSRQPLHLSV